MQPDLPNSCWVKRKPIGNVALVIEAKLNLFPNIQEYNSIVLNNCLDNKC